MANDQDFPSTLVRFEVDGTVCAELCFEVLALTAEKTKGAAAGIERAFAEFSAAHGGDFSFFQLNDSTKKRKYSKKSALMVPTWMNDADTLKQVLLGLEIHSGSTGNEIRAPNFAFFQDQRSKPPTGYLRLALPADAIADVDDALELMRMLEDYPLHWGMAGYSVLWNTGAYEARKVTRWLKPHLLRFPGVVGGEPLAYMVRRHLGLLNLSWATMVGGELLETLGGARGLENKAASIDGVTVHAVGDWAAVFAGPKPQLGDVNRGDGLPLYREVGRLLEPIRASRSDMEQVFLKPLRLETADYLERFFVDGLLP